MRQAMKILEEETRCPKCGKLRFHKATGFKGHGTGVRGVSQYEATGFEDDDRHCHCQEVA